VQPSDSLPQAERLLALLDAEFEALKIQDLTAFESHQAEKAAILQELGALALPEEGPEAQAWEPFREVIRQCRDHHRRNQILVQRKLDAIRAALKTLQGADAASSVEVYDRMGRMSANRRSRGLADA
jgi:flagellar biosynthesis/type III secretory pathway chaperone